MIGRPDGHDGRGRMIGKPDGHDGGNKRMFGRPDGHDEANNRRIYQSFGHYNVKPLPLGPSDGHERVPIGQPDGHDKIKPDLIGQPDGHDGIKPHLIGQPDGHEGIKPHLIGQPDGHDGIKPHLIGQPDGHDGIKPHLIGQPDGHDGIKPHLIGQPDGHDGIKPHLIGQLDGHDGIKPHLVGQPDGHNGVNMKTNEQPLNTESIYQDNDDEDDNDDDDDWLMYLSGNAHSFISSIGNIFGEKIFETHDEDDGSNTALVRCKRPICDKYLDCPMGPQLDSQGCATCQCLSDPCVGVKCEIGYVCDAIECQPGVACPRLTARCLGKTCTGPSTMCANFCENLYKLNSKGCSTCECRTRLLPPSIPLNTSYEIAEAGSDEDDDGHEDEYANDDDDDDDIDILWGVEGHMNDEEDSEDEDDDDDEEDDDDVLEVSYVAPNKNGKFFKDAFNCKCKANERCDMYKPQDSLIAFYPACRVIRKGIAKVMYPDLYKELDDTDVIFDKDNDYSINPIQCPINILDMKFTQNVLLDQLGFIIEDVLTLSLGMPNKPYHVSPSNLHDVTCG
ncbi:hypothetical protein HELRODRAFT_159506 [Helobdella robusta]|uniref:Antistasin-like domain-containing protein n=1 Tax=Helobdella robusta TaxID=6412 RepID=T1EP40_HELRO|nr:hypothetical protein HELRODRAFT_159506 [Helobdella robusta]ESO12918.1 hypothetical protein HELRODRAFT_159506 [Helobdella robusta]